jgi:glycine hydroxymethyltransferase
MSPTVEGLVSFELSHRYGDYAGVDVYNRKYTGNRYLADLDAGAQAAVASLFNAGFADLRPLSGHIAGISVLMALCKPGDLVLELDSPGGGHRLAEKLANAQLCPLRVLPLPLDAENYTVDARASVELIARERPRVVILGSSLFLFPHPIAPLAKALHEVGGILLFDASHVLGLIAGGAYPNPLDEGADVITSSTHKTFAGPQGGLLLTNDHALYNKIAPAIYPALVTNHHLHRIPATWAVCEEWKAFGRDHAAAVVANARALGAALHNKGLNVVGTKEGYTSTHTILVADSHAKANAAKLEKVGILTTPVGLPSSLGGACLRLGVQEITRRGMTPHDATEIAALICDVLTGAESEEHLTNRVAALGGKWTEFRFTWSSVSKSVDGIQ